VVAALASQEAVLVVALVVALVALPALLAVGAAGVAVPASAVPQGGTRTYVAI